MRTSGGNTLSLSQLIAFSPTGKLLTMAPAATASSSTWAAAGTPANLINGCWNAWAPISCPPYSAGDMINQVTVRASWSVPSAVSTVYVMNNPANLNAIALGQSSWVEVINQDGSVAASQLLGNAPVSTLNLDASLAPINPDPASAFQASASNQGTKIRYVRMTQPNPQYMNFREFMVFDTTGAWCRGGVCRKDTHTNTPHYTPTTHPLPHTTHTHSAPAHSHSPQQAPTWPCSSL